MRGFMCRAALLAIALTAASQTNAQITRPIAHRAHVLVSLDGSSPAPLAGATITATYAPSGLLTAKTDQNGEAFFLLPVDASVTALSIEHPALASVWVSAHIEWTFEGDSATARVHIRNTPPYPTTVNLFICRGEIRRVCQLVPADLQVFAGGAAQSVLDQRLTLGSAFVQLPQRPDTLELAVFTDEGASYLFSSFAVVHAASGDVVNLIIDEGAK